MGGGRYDTIVDQLHHVDETKHVLLSEFSNNRG